MGLLDDAIREHLELKRRSGADPGEIAHKEHEALAPVFPDEEALEADDQQESLVAEPHVEEASPAIGFEPAEDGRGPLAQAGDFTHVGQETAELDMSTVIEGHEESPAAPVAARPVRAAQMSVDLEQSENAPPPEEIPGQERLTFE
jgi:hypothetical protein